MEYLQITDIFSMFQALLTGIGMGIYYDVFRFFRRIFKFSPFSVAMQDLIFWITSAIPVFFICIKLNGGFLRIYFIIFALAGWFIYFKTTGKLIFMIFDLIVNIFRRFFATIRRFFIKIAEKIYSKIST